MNNKIQSLGKIVNIQSSTRIFEKEYVQKGIPFYRSKEIIEKHNGNLVSTQLFISGERFNKIKRTYSIPQEGDILLTSVGTIGIPYIVKEEEQFYFKDGNLTWFNNFSKKIDNQYLYYWFLSESGREALNSILIGTTQKALTIKDLKDLELSLPPLSEQKRISNILSSFDNKIELLRKENNTLEDIAQSIFKEWFVKYNFPNKDGKPYRDNNGKMIDSELGLIPNGWRVGKLGEFGRIVCGKTPSKNVSDYFNGKYPFIKIPDMQDMFITRSEDSLTELGAKHLTGKLLPSGSICVSCIATIGKVSITTQDSFTNQQINAIIPKEGTLEYFYFTLSNMKGYLEQIGNRGSTTFNINTNMFSNLLIVYPPELILSNYHTNANILLISIQENMKEIETLSKMKSALLYKLIS